MSRSELEQKAFDNARSDMMNIDFSDEHIWNALKQCSDDDLIDYIGEME